MDLSGVPVCVCVCVFNPAYNSICVRSSELIRVYVFPKNNNNNSSSSINNIYFRTYSTTISTNTKHR